MGTIDEILNIPSPDQLDHDAKAEAVVSSSSSSPESSSDDVKPKIVSSKSSSDDDTKLKIVSKPSKDATEPKSSKPVQDETTSSEARPPNEKAGLKRNVISDIMELQAKVRGVEATVPGAVAVDATEPVANNEKEKGGDFATPAVRGRVGRRNSASGPGAEYVQARAPGLSATFMLTMRRREMTRRTEATRNTPAAQPTEDSVISPPSFLDAPVECHPAREEDYETKDQRKRWYMCAGLVVCLVIIGVAVGVGVSVSSNSNAQQSVRMTEFSPYTQDCGSLQGQTNPHVLTQCLCTGTVSIVPKDIASRYYDLTQSFISAVDPQFHDSMDSCSPSNQALLWLASGEGGSTKGSNLGQRYSLGLLFVLWSGPKWGTTAGWLSSDDECTWAGLGCNDKKEITSIALPQNNVTGQFPLNAALPTSLELLDLSQNQMHGSIASSFGKHLKLTSLGLGHNQLNGTLPSGIGMLTALQKLDLGYNQLSGTFPTDLGNLAKLQDLSVSSNNINGTIPTSFGGLRNLQNIDLSANSFSGQLPSVVGLWKAQTIHLESNYFAGSIPTEVGLLSQLQVLALDFNGFSGSIPTQFYTLGKTLTHFSATVNKLSGTISTSIGKMLQMREFLLSQNSLTGKIPIQLGDCIYLRNLDLDHNKLHGTVPSELAAISSLASLNLVANQLSGSVPMEICNLNVAPNSCLKCNCCTCQP